MDSLIDEAWRLYREAVPGSSVVKPSIPILYFGDRLAYARSPIKVVTVALNPSRKEFPTDDPFARFRRADGILPDLPSDEHREAYLEALDAYYRERPYRSWFGWFDEVLHGMDASYYAGEASTALHTDLCSPLATDPTWSRLGDERRRYENDGAALWHRLVESLAPDVVLVSIARADRDRIAFARPDGWQELVVIQRADPSRRPYRALFQRAELPGRRPVLLVFGPAAQQPFATLAKPDRRLIGRTVLEVLRG